jgi:hypothetical protein
MKVRNNGKGIALLGGNLLAWLRAPGLQIILCARSVLGFFGPIAQAAPGFSAGFATESITPDVSETAEPIWIAGFGQNRRARTVHDPLLATAVAVSNGSRKGVIVSLDSIGLMHDQIQSIRRAVQSSLALDFVIVASTHTHQAPDVIGIWGPNTFKTGANDSYLKLVRDNTAKAIRSAVAALEPVAILGSEIESAAAEVVFDTRKPAVFDSNARTLRFVSKRTGRTLGTIVQWANHPEVLWDANTALSSDFVHYLRAGIAEGIRYDDRVVTPGLGGAVLYLNGAIGGLMCTPDTSSVFDPVLAKEFVQPSFEKARAVGYRVASSVLANIEQRREVELVGETLEWTSKPLLLPIDNLKFFAAATFGIIKRKVENESDTSSEVGLLRLAEEWIATVPGELYPEIANGGIQTPAGNDFGLNAPVEVPALRSRMYGRSNMIIGLANDQIGYIVPRSQWDAKAPFAYGLARAPYGEENSMGPRTAPLIHAALMELIESANRN